jgi:hypothetical protein
VLSLRAREADAAKCYKEVDEAVRTRLATRILKPLDLLVTARVKAPG